MVKIAGKKPLISEIVRKAIEGDPIALETLYKLKQRPITLTAYEGDIEELKDLMKYKEYITDEHDREYIFLHIMQQSCEEKRYI